MEDAEDLVSLTVMVSGKALTTEEVVVSMLTSFMFELLAISPCKTLTSTPLSS